MPQPAGPQDADTFVGRSLELTALTAALRQAATGDARLALMAGEPGIGKTELARAFARAAGNDGALVLWGSAWEDGGAPPYWPWVQVLRSYGRQAGAEALAEAAGPQAAVLGQLLPELGTAPAPRLVLLVWQALHRNEWIVAITTALAAGRNLPSPPPNAPGPFSMSDPDRVRTLLTDAGFADPQFESLEEPMYFGARADDAHPFIAGLTAWMLEGLDEDGKARALDDLRTTIGKHETRNGVVFASAAWLITTAPS